MSILELTPYNDIEGHYLEKYLSHLFHLRHIQREVFTCNNEVPSVKQLTYFLHIIQSVLLYHLRKLCCVCVCISMCLVCMCVVCMAGHLLPSCL